MSQILKNVTIYLEKPNEKDFGMLELYDIVVQCSLRILQLEKYKTFTLQRTEIVFCYTNLHCTTGFAIFQQMNMNKEWLTIYVDNEVEGIKSVEKMKHFGSFKICEKQEFKLVNNH